LTTRERPSACWQAVPHTSRPPALVLYSRQVRPAELVEAGLPVWVIRGMACAAVGAAGDVGPFGTAAPGGGAGY